MLKKFDNKSATKGDTSDMNSAALRLAVLQRCNPLEMAQAYAAFPNGGVRRPL